MKLTALPFLLGSYTGGYFIEDYSFAVATTIIMFFLILTKQIKII